MINDKCGGCRVGQRREVQGLIPKGFGSSNLPLRICIPHGMRSVKLRFHLVSIVIV